MSATAQQFVFLTYSGNERAGGICCSAVCCAEQIQNSFSRRTSKVLRQHRIYLEPQQSWEMVPIYPRGQLWLHGLPPLPSALRRHPCREALDAQPHVSATVTQPGTAQHGTSHSAQLGAKGLGHLQRLGTAETPSPEGCRRPPRLSPGRAQRQERQERQMVLPGRIKCIQLLSQHNNNRTLVLFLTKCLPAPGLTTGAPLLHSLPCGQENPAHLRALT